MKSDAGEIRPGRITDQNTDQNKEMETESPTRKVPVYAVTERFFGMLGMARRAGKTVFGTDPICTAMRGKNKPALVVIVSDASENTREKLIAKCAWYGVPCRVAEVGGEDLAHRLGRTGFAAAVAVTDPDLAREILNACKGREWG